MRDSRMDKAYFDSYLKDQYARIEKQRAKLADCNDEGKRQRILCSLTGFEVNLLRAEFSAGTSVEKLRELCLNAVVVIGEYNDLTEENLLMFLSLAIMLELKGNELKNLFAHHRTIEANRLLSFLADYLENGTINWNQSKQLRSEYAVLDDLFKYSDKENILKAYLKKWYDNHSEYSWYDSHLSDACVYCGYWSFEAAAIAKILGLKESILAKSEYYPVL